MSVTLREGDVWYYGGQTKRCISWRHLFLGRSSDKLLLKTDIHTSILLCFAFFLLSHSLKKSPDFDMMKKTARTQVVSARSGIGQQGFEHVCTLCISEEDWRHILSGKWTKSPGLELLRHIQHPMVKAASCGQLGRLSKGSWTWEIWNVAYRQ